MDFALHSTCGTSWEEMVWQALWLAPFMGVPFLFWLVRSPRDARDVLLAAPALPVSRSRRLLDLAHEVLPLAILLLPLLAGMGLLYGFLFFDSPGGLLFFADHRASPGPVGDLLSKETVLVGLAACAWGILRRQLRRSEPDVLSLHTRA